MSAATLIASLETRRDAIGEELAALDATKAGGKPNAAASGIDHTGYKKSLYDELAAIASMLSVYQARLDGPWEIVTPAFTS